MRKTRPLAQPVKSPILTIPGAKNHELVGAVVTGVRRLQKFSRHRNEIVEHTTHGLFIQVKNCTYVCTDFEYSSIKVEGAKPAQIAASSLMWAKVDAAIEHNGNTLLVVGYLTFAQTNDSVLFTIPELSSAPEPEVPELPDPCHDWIAIMQIVRQECSSCSKELAMGCCEIDCEVWAMKVKAHHYHSDLYGMPCDSCPNSPDKGSSDVSCGGKCAKQIKLGFGVAESGPIKEYIDHDLAKNDMDVV